jgi:N-acyl-D-aspartate/D-glutamate deacylase
LTHDLVVRGGTVVDGLGSPAATADVAVEGGRIVDVGRVDGPARRVIDADGLLVTPGFVDIHTHYDGQVTWDSQLAPSCWHGVTTVVMGNCGVGFAPCSADRRSWLVSLMEAVEEIPGTALHEGMTWAWESFPEYLDYLSRLRRTMDFGTQIAHGSLRAHVMGERGARNDRATSDDVRNMAELTREAIELGALGFTMSRTFAHKTADGHYVPGTLADDDEIFGITSVLGELESGVIEVTPLGVVGEDLEAPARQHASSRG